MNRLSLTLTTIAATTLLAGAAFAGNGNGNGNGTLVCHINGNGTVSPLYVNANAIGSHLNHGDVNPSAYAPDNDGDGYGTPGADVIACAAPAGYVGNTDDCDDADAAINPGATELCGDGIDDDCDGLIDEECGPCDTVVYSECIIDLVSGASSCDNGNPLTVVSTAGGLVLRADMANWTAMVATADVDLPASMFTNWALNIGNSPSNNGWGGDGSQFANDAEMQLYNNSVQLIQNDYGLAAGEPHIISSFGPATDLAGDVVEATVCDGYFAWESSTSSVDVTDPHIFQIDGDEADFQAGGSNDTYLWVGVGRTIGTQFRSGTGVQTLTLTFWD